MKRVILIMQRRIKWNYLVIILMGIGYSNGVWGGINNVPEQYVTIQAGIDASVDGDTVLLAPGTYTGPGNKNLNCLGREITVTSQAGSGACIIDMEGNGRGFIFNSGETSNTIVRNLTLRNGSSPGVESGGGISCTEDSSPRIESCVLTGCTSQSHGGGVYSDSSSPTILDCIIINNHVLLSGGGIYAVGGSPTIMNSAIHENSVRESGGGLYLTTLEPSAMIVGCTIFGNAIIGNITHYGGGICIIVSPVTFSNCDVWGNMITGNEQLYGAGMFTGNTAPCFINCRFFGNSITGQKWILGGGVACGCCEVSSPEFFNCQIFGNSITGETITYGGGLSCYDGQLKMDRCQITGNSVNASVDGGGVGIYVTLADTQFKNCIIDDNVQENDLLDGGGLYLEDSSHFFSNCRISGNSILGDGGGLYVQSSSVTLNNTEITNNIALNGGGIASFDVGFEIVNGLIHNNHAGNNGGAIHLTGSSQMSITQTTVTANHASVAGGALCVGSNPDIQIGSSVLWGNHPQEIAFIPGRDRLDGTISVTYTLIQGGFTGEGNLDTDPTFALGPGGEYYLSQINSGEGVDSPGVNAGPVMASDLFFETGSGQAYFSDLTTRSDGVRDSGWIDLGYHYSLNPPTPWPTETPTATASSTPTATPSVTPTMTPTATSSPTQTPTPGFTPTTPPSQTPHPSSTPIQDIQISLDLPETVCPGEMFQVRGIVTNSGAAISDVPVYFALQYHYNFWFWPRWTHFEIGNGGTVDLKIMNFPTGETNVDVISPFRWPETGDYTVDELVFYGLMLDPSNGDVMGDVCVRNWGYGPCQ